jgi:hypothetical protein
MTVAPFVAIVSVHELILETELADGDSFRPRCGSRPFALAFSVRSADCSPDCPSRDSTKAPFTKSMVSPQWVRSFGHGVFGITLGVAAVALSRMRMRPPARVLPVRREEARQAAA